MIFKINDIIEFIDEGIFERIIWISSNYTYCYTIKMYTKKLYVKGKSIKDLEDNFYSGKIRINNDIRLAKLVSESDLSKKEKELLDKAWEVIKLIALEKNEPEIFDKKYRGKFVQEVIEELSVSKSYVYKCLRKYWQGGKIKIALLSNLSNCGGKENGKERDVSKHKLGRPNAISKIDPNKQGVNVTKEIKEIFEIAYKKYYYKNQKTSLKQAYELMIVDYFSTVIEKDGQLVKVKLPKHLIPTFYQFKYHYYKTRNIREEITKKHGKKEFQLNFESIKSNSTYEVNGPGYRYQIDATRPPVQLVSRLARDRCIGTPVVYFVIDVFSRLITGTYIGLNNPSWEGASSALYNCIEDKVEFCKRYGIEIDESKWPNSTLPRKLLADNGEFAGELPSNLIENLNIEIENTPSYMGKCKGIVEQSFRLSEHKYNHLLPGITDRDFRKKGKTDYMKEATLDIEDFTRIVLRTVIHHNNSKIENYPRTQAMLNDKIYPTPVNLWNWGIKKFREFS